MLPVLLLALAGLSRPDEVVASVGAEKISAETLASRVAWNRAQGGRSGAADVLEAFIDDTLLAAEARRQGLASDPEVRAQVEAERRRLAAERLLEKEVYTSAAPDDAVLRALYHANADSVRLRLLLFASREAAQAALDRLRGGSTFAAEAKGSLDPSAAARQADTGMRPRSQLDALLAEAAFSAPVGSLIGPVPLQLGFAVAQLLERHVGDDRSFEARRESLRRFAAGQLRDQVRRHYLAQLRRSSSISVDEAFLAASGSALEAAPGEDRRVVATVAGRTLRYGEVLAEARRLSAGQEGAHLGGARLKAEVARGLADNLLLEQTALERGHGDAPGVVAQLRITEWEAMIRALAGRIRGQAAAPSDGDVEGYYRQHPSEFQRPAHRTCSHILAESQTAAEAARERLVRGEPFETVARDASRDAATAPAGGLLGDFDERRIAAVAGPEAEPTLAAALRDTAPGAPSAPARSRAGWHLVRCGPWAPASTAPLSEIRQALADRLRGDRGLAALRTHVAALRSATRVAVDREALERAAADLDRDIPGRKPTTP